MLCYQVDESCISQHMNERRVRTLEEDDEAVSSHAADDVANEECDLEELASVENICKDHEEDTDDDDVGDDEQDSDNDSNTTRQSEDSVGQDMLVDDARNAIDVVDLHAPNSEMSASEDVSPGIVSGGVSLSNCDVGIDEDTVNVVTGEKDSFAVDSTGHITADADEPNSDEADTSAAIVEFPDTSIDLQHISGSKFVSTCFLAFVSGIMCFFNACCRVL